MKLWSDSFEDGQAIPTRFAFGKHDAESHVTLCENENPHLAWSELPEGTRSLVLIVHDSDVPSRGDDVNQHTRERQAGRAPTNRHQQNATGRHEASQDLRGSGCRRGGGATRRKEWDVEDGA